MCVYRLWWLAGCWLLCHCVIGCCVCVIRLCRPIFHLPELLFLFTHPYTYYYISTAYTSQSAGKWSEAQYMHSTCRRITLTYSHSENAAVRPPTRESFVRRQSFDSRKTSNACRCVHSYLSPDRVSSSSTTHHTHNSNEPKVLPPSNLF